MRIFDCMRNLGIAAGAVALLVMLPVGPPAVKAQSPEESGAVLNVDVDIVSLYASVRDKKNGLVGSLSKDDFELAEDGKPQTIKYFNRETDIPLTLGLLIDVSGSQQNLIETERQAGAQFFTSVLKSKDVAFLLSFGADSELLQDITGSARSLQQGLGRLKLNAGYSGPTAGPLPSANHPRGTVLYDAVYLAANDMLAHESGRKAIILITDGEDQGSKLNLKDSIEAAQKADAIIYGILYVDRQFYGGFNGGFNIGYSGSSVLKQMAEETGGRLFEVSKNNSLQSIFTQIQDEMRTQYQISYTPTNSRKDGTYRKIDLRTHDKDQKVQVRKGYYALPAQ